MSSIEGHVNMRAYFRDRVLAALRRQGIKTHERTEFYLVNLLAEFAVHDDIEEHRHTLVELFAKAMEAEGPERLRRFKSMGDRALYRTGFFAENLTGRGITRDYVMTMGERAYSAARQIAHRVKTPREAEFAETYGELAKRFGAFVRVLDDIRESTALRSPQDIVKLYERWRLTRSPIAAERLREHGLFPQASKKKQLH
ncbi:MAG: hypothetical protein IPJ88_12790 [Myxococcales bacterium]|nr:MAG: hypothetical protein IPJ88_12790 [Myxococcales bacterium]